MKSSMPDIDRVLASFESGGRSQDDVLADISAMKECDRKAIPQAMGQMSCWAMAATALDGENVLAAPTAAAALYSNDNLFYRKLHPSLKHMHEAVLQMARMLTDVPQSCSGVFTLGGTENNLLAAFAARELARERGIKRPNMVMAHTGHPSFVKAAKYFGFELRRVPLSDNYVPAAGDFAALTDESTALLVGSAPDYCFGQIDPIEALSELALERQTWLHIDAAVGATYMPMLRELGDDIPRYGFELEGVTSLSIDLHKHAYAPIGASILFCREQKYTDWHTLDDDNWPSGRLQSSGIIGSPPASPLAGAYAIMQCLGMDGYRSIAARIKHNRQTLIDAVLAVPGTRVYGNPLCTLVSLGWEDISAAHVATVMTEAGWRVNQVKQPAAIHCTLDAFENDDVITGFGQALGAAVDKVRSGFLPNVVTDVVYG